jgi:hypothetical protein
MLTMHPRVMRDAFVLLGTIVVDGKNIHRLRQMMDVIKSCNLQPDRDYTFVKSITVQEPCKLLPFDGQHVQHRMFERDQCGPTSVTFYRFPKLVSTFDVIRWLDANGIPRRPTRCYHSYDCCANWYCDGVWVDHHRGHTIASIRWAMNV